MDHEKIGFKEGTLLFHPVHGPVVVKKILKRPELGGDGWCYWLQPRRQAPVGTSFYIAVTHIQKAGFHPPLSRKEAGEILDYLKKREETEDSSPNARADEIHALCQENTPWAFAKILLLLTEMKEHDFPKEGRKALKSAAQGLTQELAFVLKIPLDRAALRIRECLRCFKRPNPQVEGALQRTG